MKKKFLRKAFILFVILAMIVPCLPLIASADGEIDYTAEHTANGTWYHPANNYQYIYNERQLAYFMQIGARAATNTDVTASSPAPETIAEDPTAVPGVQTFSGKTIVLMNDIVWNDITIDWATGTVTPSAAQGNKIYKWTPYASNDTRTQIWDSTTGAGKASQASWGFRGIFDGRGHTISGLYIEGASGVAFFHHTGTGAKVRNVTFENAYVHGTGNNTGCLISEIRASLEFNNVHINTYLVSGASYVGAFIAMPSASPYTVIIRHSTVSGYINGRQAVGGFIGHGRQCIVTFEECVCYADISNEVMYIGGFMGVSGTKNLTFNKCYFLGSLTVNSATASYHNLQGAFVTLLRNPTNVASAQNVQSTPNTTISFTDCYFAEGTLEAGHDYPVGIQIAAPQFTVSVKYGDAAANTYDCTTEADNTAVKKETAMLALFHKLYIPAATTGVVDIKGIQTNATNPLPAQQQTTSGDYRVRFVSKVDLNETFTTDNVREIGFQASLLDAYAAANQTLANVEANTITWAMDKVSPEVYTSISSNRGMDTVAASDFDAEYLASLVVSTIPFSSTYNGRGLRTFVIRPYLKTTGGDYYYGAIKIISFCFDDLAGSATISTVTPA